MREGWHNLVDNNCLSLEKYGLGSGYNMSSTKVVFATQPTLK
jgi:hypothetical protein